MIVEARNGSACRRDCVGRMKEQSPPCAAMRKAFSFHIAYRHLEPFCGLALKQRLKMAQTAPSHGDCGVL